VVRVDQTIGKEDIAIPMLFLCGHHSIVCQSHRQKTSMKKIKIASDFCDNMTVDITSLINRLIRNPCQDIAFILWVNDICIVF